MQTTYQLLLAQKIKLQLDSILEGRLCRTKNMAEYKNQHYVPQTYLLQFTNGDINLKKENFLWVLNKDTKEIEKKGIKNICSENYYYSYQVNLSDYDHHVEKKNSQFEGRFTKIKYKADCIRNFYLDNKEPIWFTASEIEYVIQFIILQLLRVPKTMDVFLNQILGGFKEMNEVEGITQSEVETKNEVKKTVLPLMFNDTRYDNIKQGLLARNMYITIVPHDIENAFVITDNPVFITNSTGSNAIINHNTEITIAITKNIGLSFHGYGDKKGICKINSDGIDKINTSFMKNAQKCCFSGYKSVLERLLTRL